MTAKALSAIHPIDDFVVRVVEHADVIRALDREKFDKWKFSRKLAPHSDRDHFIVRAVKNYNSRGGIESRYFSQACAIVIAFDQ